VPTPAGHAVLCGDFASFAVRAFRELNPRALFCDELACRADRGPAHGRAPRQDPPAARQTTAASSEVATGLDRLSGLVPRAPAEPSDPVRHLRVFKATADR
jgi:hypothetical protein